MFKKIITITAGSLIAIATLTGCSPDASPAPSSSPVAVESNAPTATPSEAPTETSTDVPEGQQEYFESQSGSISIAYPTEAPYIVVYEGQTFTAEPNEDGAVPATALITKNADGTYSAETTFNYGDMFGE
jgi:hypothetical protein